MTLDADSRTLSPLPDVLSQFVFSASSLPLPDCLRSTKRISSFSFDSLKQTRFSSFCVKRVALTSKSQQWVGGCIDVWSSVLLLLEFPISVLDVPDPQMAKNFRNQNAYKSILVLDLQSSLGW
jgi:hypothetical protein